MHSQCVGNEEQVAELHLGPCLHALDRGSVDASLVGEGLLGHGLLQATHADAVADGPAGLKDPLGLIGWHSTNALTIMSISQQQICRIF
ncbi:hypothetical protein TUE45_06560 [Streptomyces reticuli]|nr:hypothetical protein TUE45_06560 [Streptomyces reticuli]